MVCRLRRAFINPFNVILFILGIISLVTDVLIASDFARNASTAIIIFTMILISGAIRLVQELRAKNAAQQLDRLIHESITVRRGGELIEIPAEKLVVGDIVLLSAGDRVPADIRLTSVTDLFISQAAITGESAILEKTCRTLSYGSPETLTQLENLVFMGQPRSSAEKAKESFWRSARTRSTAALQSRNPRTRSLFSGAPIPSHGSCSDLLRC